jgi:hypothetical protein
MGDRTGVTLTVLTSQSEGIEELLGYGADCADTGSQFTSFEFSDVNYGVLENLEKLTSAGIAFNSEWGSGGDYGPGVHWCRFTPDGECRENEVSDEGANPPIEKLMELIDKPEELRGYIVAYHYDVTPPPWDNQEEYGKLFRTKQLISS